MEGIEQLLKGYYAKHGLSTKQMEKDLVAARVQDGMAYQKATLARAEYERILREFLELSGGDSKCAPGLLAAIYVLCERSSHKYKRARDEVARELGYLEFYKDVVEELLTEEWKKAKRE